MIEYKFTLYTVPHTGAHFTVDLLNIVGLTPKDYPTMHWQTHAKPLPTSPKFLLTARDPYLVGLRYILKGNSIETLAHQWARQITNLYNIDHFVLDIGCREADRLTHVCDALNFLDIDPDPCMVRLRPYVNAWKPLNSTEESVGGVVGAEKNKEQYLLTGKLPQEYDWSILDDAVQWYKSLPTNDYV